MAAVTPEPNYMRKSHRVNFPLLVEVQGQVYQVRDWSIHGVGILDFELPDGLERDDVIDAKVVIPLPDSAILQNTQLVLKNHTAKATGFAFHNPSVKFKRVLRHYIELGVEGRIDNLEDLVAIMSTPQIDTPIEDAITFSEQEAENLLHQFKKRSRMAIILGIVFFITIVGTIFYNVTYRITATGVVTGNVKRITANLEGVVDQILVPEGAYVAASTSLFSVAPPPRVEATARRPLPPVDSRDDGGELTIIEAKITRLREELNDSRHGELAAALRDTLDQRAREQEQARTLYQRQLITFKDLNAVQDAFNKANSNWLRERDSLEQQQRRAQTTLAELQEQHEHLTRNEASGKRHSAAMVLPLPPVAHRIEAPVEGRIFRIDYSPGEYVKSDTAVMLLETGSKPFVVLNVSSDDVLKLEQGMETEIYVPALNREFSGRIGALGYAAVNAATTLSIEASLNETLVRIDFTDANVRLPLNSRVEVWVKTFRSPFPW